MFRKLFSRLDPKYTKICLYASITFILTVITLMLLHYSSPFWVKLWHLFTAVLRPIVLGFIFAYLLSPIVEKLEAKMHEYTLDKAARPVAVVISIILFVGLLALFVSVVGIMVYQSFSTIKITGLRELIETARHDFAAFSIAVQRKLADFGLSLSTIRTIVSTFADAVTNLGSGLLFGVIFAVYFLLDTSNITGYWARAYHLIAGHKAEAQFQQFCHDADTVFSGYIRGQFIDASIVGTLTCLVLSIAGIPNAVVIGMLTGFGNLIPYVGPVVGYITLTLVCLSSGAYVKLAIGAVCLAVILFVDGNILNPKLLSNSIKIHPLLVIIALIGGGAIGGFVGMIVGVPIAALGKVQLDRYLDRKDETQKTIDAGAHQAKEVAKDIIEQFTDDGNHESMKHTK
ncbi:MAG: AI-2E family transporter [Mogibacterium sp.]|nr:AI-2E family transporter [Mogibacterium sp.]